MNEPRRRSQVSYRSAALAGLLPVLQRGTVGDFLRSPTAGSGGIRDIISLRRGQRLHHELSDCVNTRLLNSGDIIEGPSRAPSDPPAIAAAANAQPEGAKRRNGRGKARSVSYSSATSVSTPSHTNASVSSRQSPDTQPGIPAGCSAQAGAILQLARHAPRPPTTAAIRHASSTVFKQRLRSCKAPTTPAGLKSSPLTVKILSAAPPPFRTNSQSAAPGQPSPRSARLRSNDATGSGTHTALSPDPRLQHLYIGSPRQPQPPAGILAQSPRSESPRRASPRVRSPRMALLQQQAPDPHALPRAPRSVILSFSSPVAATSSEANSSAASVSSSGTETTRQADEAAEMAAEVRQSTIVAGRGGALVLEFDGSGAFCFHTRAFCMRQVCFVCFVCFAGWRGGSMDG